MCAPFTTRKALDMESETSFFIWRRSISFNTERTELVAWFMLVIALLRTPEEGIWAWATTLSRSPASAAPTARTVREVPISSAA